MKNKNTYWIIAGGISVITFFVHLIIGQIDLINPLIESGLTTQVKTELLAVWHMISLLLLASSVVFIFFGIKNFPTSITICLLSNLYLAFGLIFIIVSIYIMTFAPQWILLLPIGIFGLLGIKKHSL
jgi:hypothetical protein